MNNVTITMWVNPNDEMYFFSILKFIDSLPIENEYTWRTEDVRITKSMISNWISVNIPIETYVKFRYSFEKNKGKFVTN